MSLDSDLPFGALLDHIEVAVTAPALRFRTDDLGAISSRLLQELAPARRTRPSPGAERTFARYSWPRNVTQLGEALQHALRTRPVGEIQHQDLAAYCRTASRRLLRPSATRLWPLCARTTAIGWWPRATSECRAAASTGSCGPTTSPRSAASALTLVETTLGSLYAAGARDVSVWYMNEVQDRQAANTISMRLRSR